MLKKLGLILALTLACAQMYASTCATVSPSTPQATIQSDSNSCGSGNTLVFSAGTYNLASTSNPFGAALELAAGVTYTGPTSGSPAILLGAGGYPAMYFTGNTVTVENLTFNAANLILETGTSNIEVQNNVFENIDCLFSQESQTTALYVNGGVTTADFSSNTFQNLGSSCMNTYNGNTGVSGIGLFGFHDLTIEHNSFSNMSGDGISMSIQGSGGGYDGAGGQFLYNTFTGMHRMAIEFLALPTNPSGLVIAYNNYSNAYNPWAYTFGFSATGGQNTVIHDNVLNGNVQAVSGAYVPYGIEYGGTGATAYNNIVEGYWGWGFALGNAPGGISVTNNYICGPTMYAAAPGSGSTPVTGNANGFISWEASSQGGTFTGNTTSSAMTCGSVTPPTLTGLTVAGNLGATSVTVSNTLQMVATCNYSDGSTTNCTTTDSHGNVASGWTSSVPADATINATSGLLTGVAVGSTNITATASTFTSPAAPITVTSSAVTLTGVSVAGTGGATSVAVGSTLQAIATCTYSDSSSDNCTTTDTHGTLCGSWTSSVPADGTISTGGLLTGVAIGSTNIGCTAGTFTSSPFAVSIISSSQVATPIFSPGSTSFLGSISVSISDTTFGATIYYTTDGTTPTTSSSVYSGALSIGPLTTTVRAMAAATGFVNSAISSALYTAATPPPTPPQRGNIDYSQIKGIDRKGTGQMFQMACTYYVPGDLLNYDAYGNACDAGSPGAAYFGQGYATSSGGETLITLASVPLAQSTSVFENGLLVSPADYSISGSVVTLATPLSSGVVVVVDWASAAATSGGISFGSGYAQIRSYGSGSGTTGSSITMPLPAGTQVGDLVVAFTGAEYTLSLPSGWTQDYIHTGFIWNPIVISKIMTSGDIAAGSVVVSAGGSGEWTYQIVAFYGNTGGIRETDGNASESGVTPEPVTTSSAVAATDSAIYFGSARNSPFITCTVSRGVLIDQSNDGSAASSCLYTESLTAAGSFTADFNYPPSGASGDAEAIVIVEH